MDRMTLKKVAARGKVYYEDLHGNLILGCYVKEDVVKVRVPKDILPWLTVERTAKQEHVVMFTLDGNNALIRKHTVTVGLANQSQVHPREVFRRAIADNAISIILAHNHPSGNTEASESDLVMTRRLVECGKTLGIPVIDHVIVTQMEFCSLRERYPNYFY